MKYYLQSLLGIAISSALLLGLSLSPTWASAEEAANNAQTNKEQGLFSADFNKAPTYIKSKKMTLFSQDRKVEYQDNVEVLHEDMKLTCDKLEALYTEQNAIDKIFAYDNVFITRENGTQARSEKAVYEKATEVVTLTINPEVQENGSVVTADTIRIYLQEDRSEAEGEVRVKLVQQEPEKKGEEKKKKDKKSTNISDVLK